MGPDGSLNSNRDPLSTQRPPLTSPKERLTSMKTVPAMLQSRTNPEALARPARFPRYDWAIKLLPASIKPTNSNTKGQRFLWNIMVQ